MEISPLCVLDFYVVEGHQRGGMGRQLFDQMLSREDVKAERLGYDRPSPKLIGFLRQGWQGEGGWRGAQLQLEFCSFSVFVKYVLCLYIEPFFQHLLKINLKILASGNTLAWCSTSHKPIILSFLTSIGPLNAGLRALPTSVTSSNRWALGRCYACRRRPPTAASTRTADGARGHSPWRNGGRRSGRRFNVRGVPSHPTPRCPWWLPWPRGGSEAFFEEWIAMRVMDTQSELIA